MFWTSFRGARRPLAREPDDEYLNDDITETNFSIDFSAMSEYRPKWEMFDPNFPSSVFVPVNVSFRLDAQLPKWK